jgi:hypothetical protein
MGCTHKLVVCAQKHVARLLHVSIKSRYQYAVSYNLALYCRSCDTSEISQ